jgi:hypothetical protein
MAEKLGCKYVPRPPAPNLSRPKVASPEPKPEPPERRYTLAGLEAADRELAEGDSGRHMNPGRTRRHNLYWQDQVKKIRAALIKQGGLPS